MALETYKVERSSGNEEPSLLGKGLSKSAADALAADHRGAAGRPPAYRIIVSKE